MREKQMANVRVPDFHGRDIQPNPNTFQITGKIPGQDDKQIYKTTNDNIVVKITTQTQWF